MGGGSPILKFTQMQADALQHELRQQGYGTLPVHIAMRYWTPTTEEAIRRILQDGMERLIVLPLYPHFSYATTGSSLNELGRVLKKCGMTRHVTLSILRSYWDHPLYQQAVSEMIRQAMHENTWSCPPEDIQLLFTAHSLPMKHVRRTGDPYPQQIFECAKHIAETHFSENPWDLSYQSQVGNMISLGRERTACYITTPGNTSTMC